MTPKGPDVAPSPSERVALLRARYAGRLDLGGRPASSEEALEEASALAAPRPATATYRDCQRVGWLTHLPHRLTPAGAKALTGGMRLSAARLRDLGLIADGKSAEVREAMVDRLEKLGLVRRHKHPKTGGWLVSPTVSGLHQLGRGGA